MLSQRLTMGGRDDGATDWGATRTTRGTHRPPLRRRIRSQGAFAGTVYVRGRKTTSLTSDTAKPYIHWIVATGLAEQHAGPAPEPWPPGEGWMLKSEAPRVIHVW